MRQTNQKKFEQNRITKESYEFLIKDVKLWNNENHNTNCQDGYQFVTSCPHYLSIALYGLIPLISLFIPQTWFPHAFAQVIWFVSYWVHDISQNLL